MRRFLDDVIEHLANRTTARERASFHVAESYTLREGPVPYGTLILSEKDVLGGNYRALPPAEHHVVVAWYQTPEQLDWTRREGIANVRLGSRRGSGTFHLRSPRLAIFFSVRMALLSLLDFFDCALPATASSLPTIFAAADIQDRREERSTPFLR